VTTADRLTSLNSPAEVAPLIAYNHDDDDPAVSGKDTAKSEEFSLRLWTLGLITWGLNEGQELSRASNLYPISTAPLATLNKRHKPLCPLLILYYSN
jgi:hypothetical protein